MYNQTHWTIRTVGWQANAKPVVQLRTSNRWQAYGRYLTLRFKELQWPKPCRRKVSIQKRRYYSTYPFV